MRLDVHHDNGPGSGLKACPLCERIYDNTETATRVNAKLDAEQRERDRQFNAEIAKIEAQVRRQAIADAQVSHQHRESLLLQEIAALKDGKDADIARQVDAQVAKKEAAMAVEKQMHNLEMQKLKGELEKANRSLSERRASQRLGDMEELKIYNALQTARPQDKITRVPKGKEGADITQLFIDKGKKFGSVLWEVKNKSTFQKSDITKLLDDQRKDGLDCGALVLQPCAFPLGIAPVAQPYQGVWLCPSDHVVPFMETLRRATFDLSQAKALNDDPEARRARIFALFATSEGRARLKQMHDENTKLRELDSKLQDDVNYHIKHSAKVYEAQQRCLEDWSDAIDRLTENNDGMDF
jgi:Uncharacterized protein conserved in bacteria (DUF2130)